MGNIRNYIYGISLAMLVMTITVSCDRDDDSDTGNVTLRAGAYMSGQVLMETRALPAGYEDYNSVYPNPGDRQADIYAFLQAEGGYSLAGKFVYHSDSRDWTFDKKARTGITYYMYGVMPASADATIAEPASGSYADGAELTIHGINNILACDLNVIVGVKRRMGEADDMNESTTGIINPGSFAYTTPYTEVYLQMLLDHIYAKLTVNLSVDAEYERLRTIRLTSCSLKTTAGPATFNVTVPLTANTTGANPIGTVTYQSDGTSAGGGAALNVGDGITLTTEPQSIEGFICPWSGASGSYELVTTFDVYDKSDNLIRKQQEVTNSITLNPTGRGQAFVLNAKIAPTYLYQLSSPDFDSPNILLQ